MKIALRAILLQTVSPLVLLSVLIAACSQPAPPETLQPPSELALSAQGISVVIGPTPIPKGEATGAADITVSNEFFAVAFAVESAPPWGVARGGIVDLAIIEGGKPGPDLHSLLDFMPNYWTAWPTTYQRVELEINTPELVVVRTERDWGEVALETRFEIRQGSHLIRLHTRMTNQGEQTLEDIHTGYVSWPEGGIRFGMPGLFSDSSELRSEERALANWSAAYDEGWTVGLHAPYSEWVAYLGRDRYLKHSIAAGESREFEAWVQIENSADLSRLIETEIEFNELPAGQVSGRITTAEGDVVPQSAAIIRQQGKLYAWALARNGHYDVKLPVGEYEFYATGSGFAPGAVRGISVVEGQAVEANFADLKGPGSVTFQVVGQADKAPLDASLYIASGTRPTIQYFGRYAFFTELARTGLVELSLAPGEYVFDVSAAGGFTAKVLPLTVAVESGVAKNVTAEIEVLADPQKTHWYAADLHHHSDVLDGFTPPEFVLRAQLGAGMDLAFLSDHDSNVNNALMAELAAVRNVEFIGGTELSASWAHFNAYPIDPGMVVNPDVGSLSVQGIYAEARRLGADVIHVNHPYSRYGYFGNLEKEAASGSGPGSLVPGGYDEGFDLVEIEVQREDSLKTIKRTWQLWNAGKKAYLAGGSDVHDVWNTALGGSTGAARSYVYVPGDLTVDTFINALQAGHSYATQGPLIFPERMFGSDVEWTAGEQLSLAYRVQAVDGLRRVQLIEKGVEIQSRDFEATGTSLFGEVPIEFKVQPRGDTWYSLVVEDANGDFAFSNPIWVKTGGDTNTDGT